nr:hypothetical protein [Tanacetum cinerariifolium]
MAAKAQEEFRALDLGYGGLQMWLVKRPILVDPRFKSVGSSSIGTTHIVEKIDKLEKLIIDGKINLMDNEGKPLKNVDYSGDHDIKDEVAPVDNEMISFLASERVGYGNNSLLEQWKDTY